VGAERGDEARAAGRVERVSGERRGTRRRDGSRRANDASNYLPPLDAFELVVHDASVS